MKRLPPLLSFLLWLVPQLLAAQPQEMIFDRLTIKDGLSDHGAITAMLQDRQGYMWFGTQNGLNRYNGYEFEVFKQQSREAHNISNSYISALATDREGNIWVGTDFGLNRYNPATEHFTNYYHQPRKSGSLAHNRVTSLCTDARNNLWVGTLNAGICRLSLKQEKNANPATAVFEQFRPGAGSGLADSAVNCLFPGENGELWVGTDSKGLHRYNPLSNIFTQFVNPLATHPDSRTIWSVRQDSGGLVWVGTSRGLFSFNPETETFARHLPAHNFSVRDIREDENQVLWLATTEGLFACDRNGNLLQRYMQNSVHDNQGNSLLGLYFDQAGSLWVSVQSRGLFRYDKPLQQFTEYRCAGSQLFTANTNGINALAAAAGGGVWMGTFGRRALIYFDPNTCESREYPFPDKEQPGDEINGLYLARNGILWIGTSVSGLYRFDPATAIFTRCHEILQRKGISEHSGVYSITEDATGTLWMATERGGVVSWNEGTEQARQYWQGASAASLSSNTVMALHHGSDGQLWAGTMAGGISKINPKTGLVTRLPLDPGAAGSFPAATVLAFFEDSRNRLWIGTTNGLYLASDDRKSFRSYAGPQGLVDDFVTGICQDKTGDIWLNTNRGLSRLAISTGRFTNFDINWDIAPGTILRGACLLRDSGELLFGRTTRLIGFNPDKMLRNIYSPPVLITQINVLNKKLTPGLAEPGEEPLLQVVPSMTRQLVLDYWQNVISLEFAALNFAQPGHNQHAYQLAGFDTDWVLAGNNRKATYTNLDPGTYTFRVKGSNNDGLWNSEGQSLQLTILPPPWRTWWAYCLYAIAAVALLFAAARYWTSRERWRNALQLKRLEAEKLQELDKLKARFFTNISHEFRTPLTLILGPLEKWLSVHDPEPGRQKDLHIMKRNANRLLQLINQLLDIAKLEAGNLNLEPAPHDLVQFCRSLLFSFSSQAETQHIE